MVIYRILFSHSLRKCKTNHFQINISFSSSAASSPYAPPTRRIVAVAVAEYLDLHHNFSAEVASKLSSTGRSINPVKCDSVISILKKYGFTQTDVERLVGRIPRILSVNPQKTLEPKIKTFIDSGYSPAETANLFVIDPLILSLSNSCISTTIGKLNEIFNSHGEVYKFLKFGRFPRSCLEKYVIPNMKYLEELGVSREQIGRYLSHSPRSFSCRTERLIELVNKAEGLGVSRSGNMLLSAVKTLSQMSTGRLERKLKVLKGLGFREDEISEMIKKAPHFLGRSEEKMKKVTKYLLGSGEAEISTIVGYPMFFMYSFEKRLKHRLEIVKELKSRDLIQGKVKLSSICMVTDSKFMNKYVLPYSDKL